MLILLLINVMKEGGHLVQYVHQVCVISLDIFNFLLVYYFV
jgi:hypothetical protein